MTPDLRAPPLFCRYAGLLLGITNTFGTIPGILAPIATGYFTEDVSLMKMHLCKKCMIGSQEICEARGL